MVPAASELSIVNEEFLQVEIPNGVSVLDDSWLHVIYFFWLLFKVNKLSWCVWCHITSHDVVLCDVTAGTSTAKRWYLVLIPCEISALLTPTWLPWYSSPPVYYWPWSVRHLPLCPIAGERPCRHLKWPIRWFHVELLWPDVIWCHIWPNALGPFGLFKTLVFGLFL